MAPGSASQLMQSVINETFKSSGGLKLLAGIFGALWAASSGMGAVIVSLNVIYRVTETRPWRKQRLTAVGLTAVQSNSIRILQTVKRILCAEACVMEIARAFARMNPRPRRSILFVTLTGEEEGLLGSDYLAHYPTVPKKSIVANINIDEDLMLWPLQDLVVYGAEHSSLSKEVDEAAKDLHLDISPDSQPEQVFFIRSDQYSFVKQGVPSISPAAGTKSGNSKISPKNIQDEWEQNTYHQPQDDMKQPLDFEAGAVYARFNLLVDR